MTLIGLYNLKIDEYKKTGLREKPWKLLAMLLLSHNTEFVEHENLGEFYKKNKVYINQYIDKVEKDFNLVQEDIIEYIEKEKKVVCKTYEKQRIWDLYANGFEVLNWSLIHRNDSTPEEIYSLWYDNYDPKKNYDVEQRAIANNIEITPIDVLLNRVLDNKKDFFEKICNELTPEERNFILKELTNTSCMTCENTACNKDYFEKIKLDEEYKEKRIECSKWFNSEIIGRSKVLRKTDVNKLR